MDALRHSRLEALLDVHSYFSFGRGVSSPTALLGAAAERGYRALALCDELNVGGAVELFAAAGPLGIAPLIGASLPVGFEDASYPFTLLAASRRGYAALNALLTLALYEGETPVPFTALLEHSEDVVVLSGERSGFPTRLIAQRQLGPLDKMVRQLKDGFPGRFFVQLYHGCYPGDARRMRTLRGMAREYSLSAVAAPQVRFARKEDFPLYDALLCAREGVTVETPHPARPRTRQGYVPSAEEVSRLFPYPETLSNANALARELAFELLPERLAPPRLLLPEGVTPDEHLSRRCYAMLPRRFPLAQRAQAEQRLAEELAIIAKLELAEFFLAAAEVTDFCHSRGILAAGRGSAAASVCCYLLGITHANPVEHGLLFERFLHGGKTTMPDVDIDISSSRRQEVLDWVEARFGGEGSACEAMVANRITYRLRSAIQDVGRALGLPPEVRNKLSHALGRDYGGLRPHRAREAEARFTEVLGDAPVKETMLALLSGMEPGLTRHFAPHSGGTVLSRYPLAHYSAQFKSTNGMRVLQFDKDDAERLGLIKLDLLGLRMLSTLERAREEVLRSRGVWLDYHNLPDEAEVWEMISLQETLTLFQIESPGQTRLSGQLKPRTLTELAHQIAIHRPGPIQSGTVRPYVRRHLGAEPARYLHPALETLLAQSYGVVLFQEDVLRLAVHFAGMTWQDGDSFRKRVAASEDDELLAQERERFVAGAARHVGASPAQAEDVFEMIQGFRGYGFAQSHAFAFAQHAYASAYLKYHYPAEWYAAVLSEAPGMWPPNTIRQDARKLGIPFLGLDINRSWVDWHSEARDEGGRGIRVALTAVKGVSRDVAQELVMSRLADGPFRQVDDIYERLRLPLDVVENLVRAGAFDRLTGRREAFYRLHALRHSQAPGTRPLFDAVPETPALKRLTLPERVAWDYQLLRFSSLNLHPLDIIRHQLSGLGVVPLPRVKPSDYPVRTAGLIIARQKPPTAGGAAFYVIEDGPARVQVQVSPEVWESNYEVLRDACLLIVEGDALREGALVAIRARRLWLYPSEVKLHGYQFG